MFLVPVPILFYFSVCPGSLPSTFFFSFSRCRLLSGGFNALWKWTGAMKAKQDKFGCLMWLLSLLICLIGICGFSRSLWAFCGVRGDDCIVSGCARFASWSAGPLMCSDTFCSLTRTFNTCTHFGQALNHMNNKTDRQAANAQHMFLGDVLTLKCSGACCSTRGTGEGCLWEGTFSLCPAGWCDLDVILHISISRTFPLVHIYFRAPPALLLLLFALLICVTLYFFISRECLRSSDELIR